METRKDRYLASNYPEMERIRESIHQRAPNVTMDYRKLKRVFLDPLRKSLEFGQELVP